MLFQFFRGEGKLLHAYKEQFYTLYSTTEKVKPPNNKHHMYTDYPGQSILLWKIGTDMQAES